MTMGTSRIFRSTDASAPVLTGASGSLQTLLKAVLVNGYGSTPSLGYTLEYNSGFISAFRFKGGTRRYLRVDDTTIVYSFNNFALVSAFTSMVDLHNGTDKIPPPASAATLQYMQKTYNSSLAASAPWMIIGDDAGFYLITQCSFTNGSLRKYMWTTSYYGDYNAWNPSNKWNFLIHPNVADPSAYGASIYPHTPALSYPGLAERGSSFARGSVPIGILGFSNNSYFGATYGTANVSGIAGNKISGKLYLSPIHIYETVTLGSVILGSLPGMYEPIVLSSNNVVIYSATVAPPYEEEVCSDGSINILLSCGPMTGQTMYDHYINKVVFKVGKGFRNVQ